MDFFKNFDVVAEAARVHEANKKWWHDLNTGMRLDRNVGELCMLTVSELAEAMEGVRKDLIDAHCPEFTSEEVEIADALIRALDFRGARHPNATFVVSKYHGIKAPKNVGEALLVLVGNVYEIWRHKDLPQELTCVDWLINTLFWYAHWRGLRLLEAYEAKNAYNAVRADHQLEHRKGVHGKKW